MGLTIKPAADKKPYDRAYQKDDGDGCQDAQLLDLVPIGALFPGHNTPSIGAHSNKHPAFLSMQLPKNLLNRDVYGFSGIEGFLDLNGQDTVFISGLRTAIRDDHWKLIFFIHQLIRLAVLQ